MPRRVEAPCTDGVLIGRQRQRRSHRSHRETWLQPTYIRRSLDVADGGAFL